MSLDQIESKPSFYAINAHKISFTPLTAASFIWKAKKNLLVHSKFEHRNSMNRRQIKACRQRIFLRIRELQHLRSFFLRIFIQPFHIPWTYIILANANSKRRQHKNVKHVPTPWTKWKQTCFSNASNYFGMKACRKHGLTQQTDNRKIETASINWLIQVIKS